MPPDLPGSASPLVTHGQIHNHDRPLNHLPNIQVYKRANLVREIRWLKDPVKLADHTIKLLRNDDLEKALELVRLASKDVECTVSWNHLIDYEMSKARVADAIKLYNEVSSNLVHHLAYTEA